MSIYQNTSKSQKSVAEKIGQYTHYQREKRGFSLNEFARQTSLTTSFLLRLERGEYKSVKFDVIEKLASGFQMSIDDFLEKCGIIPSGKKLYPLDYYFKELYQFPEEAINDLKLFIQLLQLKYKKEIQEMKEAHKEYWGKKK